MPAGYGDLLEDPGDQAVVLDEVVDHRGERGRGGAQCWQELGVLARVMGVERGAEAEAVAEQILRYGGSWGRAAGAPGELLTC